MPEREFEVDEWVILRVSGESMRVVAVLNESDGRGLTLYRPSDGEEIEVSRDEVAQIENR